MWRRCDCAVAGERPEIKLAPQRPRICRGSTRRSAERGDVDCRRDRPIYSRPHLRTWLFIPSFILSPTLPFVPFNLTTQCSGSPASSLFYSSHSLSLSSTGRHVSPLTRTSTSSLSVLVARIGMLALRTSGPLVSSLNSISNRPPTLLRWPNVEFSIPSNSLPQPLVQPTSQPVAARQYFFFFPDFAPRTYKLSSVTVLSTAQAQLATSPSSSTQSTS